MKKKVYFAIILGLILDGLFFIGMIYTFIHFLIKFW
jgi:hypothetical protein